MSSRHAALLDTQPRSLNCVALGLGGGGPAGGCAGRTPSAVRDRLADVGAGVHLPGGDVLVGVVVVVHPVRCGGVPEVAEAPRGSMLALVAAKGAGVGLRWCGGDAEAGERDDCRHCYAYGSRSHAFPSMLFSVPLGRRTPRRRGGGARAGPPWWHPRVGPPTSYVASPFLDVRFMCCAGTTWRNHPRPRHPPRLSRPACSRVEGGLNPQLIAVLEAGASELVGIRVEGAG